jgi:hypothetical protein
MPFKVAETFGDERITSIELVSARTIWTEPIPGEHAIKPAKDRPVYAPLRLVSGGSD